MKRATILLFGILIAASAFRFYNAPLRYGIGDDSSRDAFVAITGARDLQLPLTGPFSSLGPFTFGPWYYWQLIAATLLLRTPYASWIYMGVASLLFVLIMYALGKRLFDTRFGLILATLAALSPPEISTAKGLTNPNLIPLFAGLSIYLFFILIQQKKLNDRIPFLWGLVVGIGINTHYQMVGYLMFFPLLLSYRKEKFRTLFWSGLGLFVSFIPMLFFELTNHWYTTRNMFVYATLTKNLYYVPYRWLWYIRDFWPEFWSHSLGLPKFASTPVILGFIMTVFWDVRKKQFPKFFIPLFVVFSANFLWLRYYWGQRFFGYLLYLHPFIFIFTAYVIWKLIIAPKTKIVGLLSFLILVVAILPAGLRELPADYPNAQARKSTRAIKEFFPDKQFRIYSCKRHDFSRTIAVAFLLSTENRLSEDGIALGFWDADCSYPPTQSVNQFGQIPVIKQLESVYPNIPSTSLVNLSHATPSALVQSGWGDPITPRRIFESTVRWWFREQP